MRKKVEIEKTKQYNTGQDSDSFASGNSVKEGAYLELLGQNIDADILGKNKRKRQRREYERIFEKEKHYLFRKTLWN